MKLSWIGLAILFAVIVIGDQMRIGRPEHKFRLTVEVETPSGAKSVSNVMSVTPNRGYGGSGTGDSSMPKLRGDALFVDFGSGKSFSAPLAHDNDGREGEGMVFLPVRAYKAAGFDIPFRDVKKMKQTVPVTGELMPLMISFADEDKPQTARRVSPDRVDQVLGPGAARGLTLTAVPNGLWPLDIGSMLGGSLVTRYIEREIAWLVKAGDPAAKALAAANIKVGEAMSAELAFRR